MGEPPRRDGRPSQGEAPQGQIGDPQGRWETPPRRDGRPPQGEMGDPPRGDRRSPQEGMQDPSGGDRRPPEQMGDPPQGETVQGERRPPKGEWEPPIRGDGRHPPRERWETPKGDRKLRSCILTLMPQQLLKGRVGFLGACFLRGRRRGKAQPADLALTCLPGACFTI